MTKIVSKQVVPAPSCTLSTNPVDKPADSCVETTLRALLHKQCKRGGEQLTSEKG
jgi:hypothetical protein